MLMSVRGVVSIAGTVHGSGQSIHLKEQGTHDRVSGSAVLRHGSEPAAGMHAGAKQLLHTVQLRCR